jgi:hypothetical protein
MIIIQLKNTIQNINIIHLIYNLYCIYYLCNFSKLNILKKLYSLFIDSFIEIKDFKKDLSLDKDKIEIKSQIIDNFKQKYNEFIKLTNKFFNRLIDYGMLILFYLIHYISKINYNVKYYFKYRSFSFKECILFGVLCIASLTSMVFIFDNYIFPKNKIIDLPIKTSYPHKINVDLIKELLELRSEYYLHLYSDINMAEPEKTLHLYLYIIKMYIKAAEHRRNIKRFYYPNILRQLTKDSVASKLVHRIGNVFGGVKTFLNIFTQTKYLKRTSLKPTQEPKKIDTASIVSKIVDTIDINTRKIKVTPDQIVIKPNKTSSKKTSSKKTSSKKTSSKKNSSSKKTS